MEDGLITTREAGRRLGMLPKSVRRAITEGRLPARLTEDRRGGQDYYLIDPTDLEAYRAAYPLRPGRPSGSPDRYQRTRRPRVAT